MTGKYRLFATAALIGSTPVADKSPSCFALAVTGNTLTTIPAALLI